jgi:hypothetical protein
MRLLYSSSLRDGTWTLAAGTLLVRQQFNWRLREADNGRTALEAAADEGHLAIVELLEASKSLQRIVKN